MTLLSVLPHGLQSLFVVHLLFFVLVDESAKSDRGKAPLTKVAQSDSALIGGERQQEHVYIHSGKLFPFSHVECLMLCKGQCLCI